LQTQRLFLSIRAISYRQVIEDIVQCKETFSGMQLRDVRSERGQASRLSEQKCYIQNSFISIFASFGLPKLNRTALANAATVSAHSHDIFTFLQLKRFRYCAVQGKQPPHLWQPGKLSPGNVFRKTTLPCASKSV